jgi:integrase
MAHTYDVRVWTNDVYKGKTTTTYIVRWKVAGTRFKERYKTKALADSFRSELLTAARKGEPFDIDTGRPASLGRAREEMSWFAFAVAYMDSKWISSAATYRRSISEALTAITPALLVVDDDQPAPALIRHALHRWAFNTRRRDDPSCPQEVRDALSWIEGHCRPVARLGEPATLRHVLDTMARRADGQPAAGSVVSKRRRVLFNAMEHAVELGHLAANPLVGFKWKAPRVASTISRRTVVNPVQARTLLAAVGQTKRSGGRLVAFFALMYFAALRPEEAATLRKHNLSLPDEGWGEVHLDEAAPYAGADWTDDGEQREVRQLKNRARGEGRTVPSPPELTAFLHAHIAEFGTGPDGRLFVGERASELPKLTYMRAWRAARGLAFTEAVAASPLAQTPYALRHACVSTWLNAGVPVTQVAEWAGHSVEVLLKVYAKTLDGQDELARRRVMEALGHGG